MKRNIDAHSTPDIYHLADLAPVLELYADVTFDTPDNRTVLAGNVNLGDFCRKLQLSVVNGAIIFPTFEDVDTTEDSPTNQRATYSAYIRAAGQEPIPWELNFSIPPSLTGSSISWTALRIIKTKPIARVGTDGLTAQQTYDYVDQQVNIAVGTLNDASTINKGRVFASVAPDIADTPTAVMINDPVLDKALVTSSEFGMVSDDATDNTAAFLNLRSFLIANPSVRFMFQPTGPGIYRYKTPYWLSGMKRFHLIGNGAKLRNVNARPADYYSQIALAIGGSIFLDTIVNTNPATQESAGSYQWVHQLAATKLIESAAANDDLVELKTPADAADFTVGQKVLIAGYDQQTSASASFPPNYRYFEHNTIKGINAGAGVITLQNRLRWSYDDRWMDLPASITPLNRSIHSVRLEHGYIEDIELLENPNWANTEFQSSSFFQAQNLVSLDLKRVTASCAAFGEGEGFNFEDCRFYGDVEPDKISYSFNAKRCSFRRLRSASGFENVTLEECDLDIVAHGWSPQRCVYKRCNHGGVLPFGKIARPINQSVELIEVDGGRFTFNGAGDSNYLIYGFATQPAITVLDVPSLNTIRVTSNAEPYPVLTLRPGTVMETDSGKRAVVTNIYRDGVSATTCIVECVFETAPVIGDVFRYRAIRKLHLHGHYWTNLDPRIPEDSEFQEHRSIAEMYVNENMHGGVVEVLVSKLPEHEEIIDVALDGFLQQVEIEITRPYTGVSVGANVTDFYIGFDFQIDTTIQGRRVLSGRDLVGEAGSDDFPAKLEDANNNLPFVKSARLGGFGVAADASENPQGYIRYTIIRRP